MADVSRERAKQMWVERIPRKKDPEGWFDPDEVYWSHMAFGFFFALGFTAEEAYMLDKELFLEGKM